MPDARCRDCVQIGIECPLGYFGGALVCAVCDRLASYVFAICAEADVRCPYCGSQSLIEPG